MPTINQLSVLSSLSTGDQVPVYSSQNGDARRVPVSAFTEFLQAQLYETSTGIGVGTDPRAWFGTYRAVDIGGTVSAVTGASVSVFGNNFFTDFGLTDRYVTTGYAAQKLVMSQSGEFQFFSAASGTQGAAISFGSAKAVLDAAGNFIVGVNGDFAQHYFRVYGDSGSNKAPVVSLFRSGAREGFMAVLAGGILGIGNTPGVGNFTDSNLAAASQLQLDSSGNLGLGVTPSANWSTSFSQKAIQISTASSLSALDAGTGNRQINLSSNVADFAASPRYIVNDFATAYRQFGGQHNWFTAPSGTAGAAITFTQAMTLDASGNFGIGTTTPQTRIHAEGGASLAAIRVSSTQNPSGLDLLVGGNGDSTAYLFNRNNTSLVFGTNNTTRGLWSAAGDFVVGTAALATTATAGFPWIPSCAGAPTGAPTAPYSNAAAMVVDTTNNRLYVRVGTTWRFTALT